MIVYTGGSFSIPHLGHYNFLRQCKELFPNSHLVVSLNTDEFIRSYKNKEPVFSYEERKRMLELVEYVDEVIPNEGNGDSKPAILRVQPDVVIIGNDWLQRDYCKQMGFDAEWLTNNGISLVFVPYTKGVSCTEIEKRLRK